MASFYVRAIGKESYDLRLPKSPYFDLILRIELVDFEGAKLAIKEARDKNGQIKFPRLLKLFASLHGTYSQPPGKGRRVFLETV